MKAIVIGTSLSGKTTIVQYLRANTRLPVKEIDEELTTLNGGEFPLDNDLKIRVLAPKVINRVLSQDNLIFFTNADYFSVDDLKKAKEKGFKIIQLDLPLEKLQERNNHRIKEQNYSDLSQWLEGMVKYQQEIRDQNLIDYVIDASSPTNIVAEKISSYCK
jgi:predicted kinase